MCFLEDTNELVGINKDGYVIRISLNDYSMKEFKVINLDTKLITVIISILLYKYISNSKI